MKHLNIYKNENFNSKSLTSYITEYIIKKKLDTPINSEDKYHPQTKEELIENIKECFNNEDYNLNCIDTSKITDMSNLFDSYVNKTLDIKFNFDVSKWDVSNVTNMESMFFNCKKFDCDLSNWDVSKVENMHSMFINCISFEGKGLDKWNVGNVVDMCNIFRNCYNFTGKYIENWDTHNVENIKSAFLDNRNFNGDLSKWNISKVKSTLNLFRGCENFSGEWISKWDVSNIKEMDYMFKGCENFDCDLSNWDVSNVETMAEMFYYCKKFTGKGLENWNVSKVKNTDDIFWYCHNLKNKPIWYKE